MTQEFGRDFFKAAYELIKDMDIQNQTLRAIESKLDVQVRLEALKELWAMDAIEKDEYVRLLKTVLKT